MRVAFLTLGCKVNYYETKKIQLQFEKAGHEIVSFEEEAEVYVINTCSVTNIADRKSRKMIHRAKRRNPDAFVAATGCYVDSSEKKGEFDSGIDLFVPNAKKEVLFDLVTDALVRRGTLVSETKGAAIHAEAKKEERTRAYLTVQNGCNQYCTYCIIPYVRGNLQSRPEPEVIGEVERLAEKGVKEVVLTGIHLSSYGVDFTDKKSFLELEGRPLIHLITEIAGVDGIERIRLGSLEPRIISERFVDDLRLIKKVCPHFHLSLQSGSDSVLKRMNRHYSTEEYSKKVELLRNCFDTPAITTDIIAGFPGETEQEFDETSAFVEKVRFSKIHVFKYSRRKGTMADAMDGQISEKEKGKRSEVLIQRGRKLEELYQNSFLGHTEKILFEEITSIGGEEYLTGHNERYVKVAVRADVLQKKEQMVNTICPVHITGRLNEELLCGKMNGM